MYLNGKRVFKSKKDAKKAARLTNHPSYTFYPRKIEYKGAVWGGKSGKDYNVLKMVKRTGYILAARRKMKKVV